MEHKFTPGQWHYSHRIADGKGKMYSTQVYCEKGETIATLSWYKMPPKKVIIEGKPKIETGTYRDGNAKLISAAPDLLEACERALEVFVDENIYGQARLLLSVAIAKALL